MFLWCCWHELMNCTFLTFILLYMFRHTASKVWSAIGNYLLICNENKIKLINILEPKCFEIIFRWFCQDSCNIVNNYRDSFQSCVSFNKRCIWMKKKTLEFHWRRLHSILSYKNRGRQWSSQQQNYKVLKKKKFRSNKWLNERSEFFRIKDEKTLLVHSPNIY